MVETLVEAYSPLIFWVTVGIVLLRVLPEQTPYWLGRGLYWFGVPWQIFDLARHSEISGEIGLTPAITVATLSVGLAIAWSVLMLLQRLNPAGEEPKRITWLPRYDRYQYGSFIIAAMLGNTGFVGLGILPSILEPQAMSWAVFFSLTQNLLGTYFIGVMIASHFGQASADLSALSELELKQEQRRRLWKLLRDILTVPSLWAFGAGFSSRSVVFPEAIELFASSSLMFVVPTSFLLMGLRLAKIDGWTSLQNALLPVGLKMVLLPALVGLGTTLLGLSGDVRLGLVLMAGMPSAFASLILAEEYDMNRDLAASSIAISTIVLLAMIPVWLVVF